MRKTADSNPDVPIGLVVEARKDHNPHVDRSFLSQLKSIAAQGTER